MAAHRVGPFVETAPARRKPAVGGSGIQLGIIPLQQRLFGGARVVLQSHLDVTLIDRSVVERNARAERGCGVESVTELPGF
ncbi:hypothetical protein RZS08_21605, partial [Arthrospira platensis SPKY1]|nr:hypothetical protein [Arthrospira platensis SPKY1]